MAQTEVRTEESSEENVSAKVKINQRGYFDSSATWRKHQHQSRLLLFVSLYCVHDTHFTGEV